MTLKFLQTMPSSVPDLPFQAGQIIHVTKLTAEMREWVRMGAAVRIDDEPEAAVLEPPVETTALPAARSRGPR